MAKRTLDAANAPAPSHRVATISKSALGPFVARAGEAALAAWIEVADKSDGKELFVVPIAADGAALGEPRVVAKVQQDATTLIVRPLGGLRRGWLLAWTALLDRGESLTVLSLGQDGAPGPVPTEVARTSDHIQWCDLVPTMHGSVAVWAEENRSGDADILATPIDEGGKPVGMPVRVARSVDEWQAVAVGAGVGLALVTKGPAEPSSPGGRLVWLTLNAQARPTSEGLTIGTRPTASRTIEAASLGDGAVLAWTDRTGADAHVMLASVDAAGHVKGPAIATPGGGTSLVALASGAEGAALVWQVAPSGHARRPRVLHVSSISTNGVLSESPAATIEVDRTAVPEMVGTDAGFALLAAAHACLPSSGGTCQGPVVPTFVRFDARLEPIQTEPLMLAETNAPMSLGWDLQCAGNRCFALAATSESPTPIFVVDLEPRASPFATPTPAPASPDAPRITSVDTVANGNAYADLAALRLGTSTIVATLETPARSADPEARPAPRAALRLRAIDDLGQPKGAIQTLTSRAVPSGGIAIAQGGAVGDGAVVAWVTAGAGRERHVHIAHLDRTSRRDHEIELTTRAKGDVSSIAMAWAGDGWLVAWIDERDGSGGDGEVVATKVDRELVRVAREERITSARGDASDVALAVHGDVAWLAWSDSRESPHEGLGDIYATTLRTTDAKRTGDEVRVLASAPHSRSPQLAPTAKGDRAVLVWIEDAAAGLDGPAAAMVALLSPDAHVIGTPSVLAQSSPGRPTSIALASSVEGVRTVVARSAEDAVWFDAVVIGADGLLATTTRPWPIFDLDAPPSFEARVAFAGDALVFDDVGPGAGEHIVRRAEVSWRK